MADLIPFDSAGDGLTPFDPSELAVGSVLLSVPTIVLEVGTSGWATAWVRDANGTPLAGRTVSWVSAAPSVIASPGNTVTDGTGRTTVNITALAGGATTITATSETVDSVARGVSVISVTGPPSYSAAGSARILLKGESRLAAWARSTARQFSAADQRAISPDDEYFDGMIDNVETEIVWPSAELLRKRAR